MTDPNSTNTVDPPAFVRAAWGMVKRGPLTVALRLLSDFATNILVWTVLAVLLGATAILFFAGPKPELVFGVAGCLAAGLGLFLALDAVVMGTVWSHAARTATDDGIALPATQSLGEGLDRFGDTLLLRGLNFATRLSVIALFCAWAIPLAVIATRSDGLFGSPVVIPALVAGGAATVYSLGAALVVMTVELVAPAYFLGRRKLGGAIREAAGLVLERPVFIYRIFVTALGVLLPALAFAWGASIAYAVTFENPDLAPFTGLLRGVANLVLFGALGLFVVMLQYSFFAYYAHRFGQRSSFPPKFLDATSRVEPSVPLEQLIPSSIVHRLSLSQVIEQSKPASNAAESSAGESLAQPDETAVEPSATESTNDTPADSKKPDEQ